MDVSFYITTINVNSIKYTVYDYVFDIIILIM